MIDFLEPSEWKKRIQKNTQLIELPQGFPLDDEELRITYRQARALDRDLLEYFRTLDFDINYNYIQRGIRQICEQFKSDILKSLHREKTNLTKLFETSEVPKSKFTNIFEFAGCEKLYLSSKYTRIISEKLGHQFEEIASLSPRVFVPERQAGISLKGIDIIVFVNDQMYFAQIKTKKDTLTGSQVSRSIKELKIHPRSMFIAALDMGSGSNPSRKKAQENGIKLQVGEEFWSEIGIEYSDVVGEISRVLKEIENSLYYE